MEKKKVLITGYTSRMVGSTRVHGDYVTFVFLLHDILTDMGFEVERRQVNIGEEIAGKYYFTFCGIAPLSSISAHYVPETHWLIDMMPNRCAIFFDDWSACGWGKSVKGALRDWERYINYKKFPYSKEILDKLKSDLKLAITVSVQGVNPPVLAPMFQWGNNWFVLEDNFIAKLITIDPSAWMKYPSVKVPPQDKRIKQWVMAALSNHTAWVNRQRFNFPVKFVGNRRMEEGVLLTEDVTIQLFANSFGVLSVGYPSAGSGWWRSRYLNAAWAETPIYSDSRDAECMGEAFRGTPREFESEWLTPRWKQRTIAQSTWIENHIESKDVVMAKLRGLLK